MEPTDDKTLALETRLAVVTEQRNNLFNTIVQLQDEQAALRAQIAVQDVTIKRLSEPQAKKKR